MRKPFAPTETLNTDHGYLLSTGASSDQFKAFMCTGTGKESLQVLLNKPKVTNEDAIDILGEFSSTFIGMLQDCNDFKTHFGFLNQGLPSLYTGGTVYLPFFGGVDGRLAINDKYDLYMAFSIRQNTRMPRGDGFVSLTVEKRAEYLWITLPSFFNLKFYSELESEQLMHLVEDSQGIVIDLLKVTTMLSTYIGLTARIMERAAKKKTPLFIINTSEHCRHVLESTNITKVVKLFANEKEFWSSR